VRDLSESARKVAARKKRKESPKKERAARSRTEGRGHGKREVSGQTLPEKGGVRVLKKEGKILEISNKASEAQTGKKNFRPIRVNLGISRTTRETFTSTREETVREWGTWRQRLTNSGAFIQRGGSLDNLIRLEKEGRSEGKGLL